MSVRVNRGKPSGSDDFGRVVIAHDFAETYGGAERIASRIASLFPDAPFWAILGRKGVAERMGVADRFFTLLPQRASLLRHYRKLAPIYPSLVNQRKLPEADLLITSSYAFAQGFRTRNGAPHLCYSYGPLRFAWSLTDDYAARFGSAGVRPWAVRAAARGARTLDKRAAAHVTRFVASSRFVANRISDHYGRVADVVWPPVDTKLFRPGDGGHDDYFLLCGRMVEPYKRPGLAIDAFRGAPYRLVVAGDGPALGDLRRGAPSNVEFVGHLDDTDLVPLMQRCAAAIFPSQDDFGLIPVEVMACGRPVIAFAGGGALETVMGKRTGEFFEEQTPESLRASLDTFNPDSFDSAAIRTHAEKWSPDAFDSNFLAAVNRIRLTAV